MNMFKAFVKGLGTRFSEYATVLEKTSQATQSPVTANWEVLLPQNEYGRRFRLLCELTGRANEVKKNPYGKEYKPTERTNVMFFPRYSPKEFREDFPATGEWIAGLFDYLSSVGVPNPTNITFSKPARNNGYIAHIHYNDLPLDEEKFPGRTIDVTINLVVCAE